MSREAFMLEGQQGGPDLVINAERGMTVVSVGDHERAASIRLDAAGTLAVAEELLARAVAMGAVPRERTP